MMMLLTGARGFIGGRLLSRLLESGHKIRVVTRTSFRCDSKAVEVVQADLTDPATDFDSLLSGCDVVFNCSGELHNDELMRALHVDATECLVAAANRLASKEHPIHFVQLSSVGAYGPARGVVRVVNEQTSENPLGVYEETKTIGDSRVAVDRNCEFFSYTILRPSNVFGKTMSNNSLRQLGKIVGKGLFFYIGVAKKEAVATYIHVDDVVAALMLCGFDPKAKSEIFNLSNDCALSELINGMADAQHVARPRLSIPEKPLRLMVSVANRFLRLPVTQARIDALVARTTYPSTKLMKVLGFVPKKNIPAMIGELFADNSTD